MESVITKTAYELTIKFLDASDIPTRFKKGKNVKTKTDLDSKIERVFQTHVEAWVGIINLILKHTKDKEQSWRFIRMTPKVEDPTIDSVTLCNDFIMFHNFLYQRRDVDKCSDDELGKLCMLFSGFQKELEKQINQKTL